MPEPPTARSAALRGVINVRSGRIGRLRLGRSTEADLIRAFGKPDRTTNTQDYGQKPFRTLEWRCAPRGCLLYTQLRRGRLSLLSASRLGKRSLPGFRTSAGTRLGMSVAVAERRERKSAQTDCVTAITKRHHGHTLKILFYSGVSTLVLYDRRAFYTC